MKLGMDILRYILALLFLNSILCKPTTDREQFGPCIGMDCMHGVMMHGDSEQGDSHKAEDTFGRLQRQDENKRTKDGPCQGMDCLHGVLMHGDSEQGVEHMEQKAVPGPEQRKPDGPCVGMDCMHGVLMHGDEQQGQAHKAEDKRKAKPEENTEQQGPCQGMDCLHGVMMHGDKEEGKEHSEEHKEMRTNKHEGKMSGTHDPEVMMHGGEGGHVHGKEVELTEEEKERNRGIPSIESLDGMLHGDMKEMLGDVPHHEEKDYNNWNKNKKNKKDMVKTDDIGGLLGGFSFPFISDSLINELEVMKRRYLSKFWGDEEDEIAYSDEDKSVGIDKGRAEDMRVDVNIVGNTQSLDKANHQHVKPKSKSPGKTHNEGL